MRPKSFRIPKGELGIAHGPEAAMLKGRFHMATRRARTSPMVSLRPAVPKLSMSSLVAQEQGLARLEAMAGWAGHPPPWGSSSQTPDSAVF